MIKYTRARLMERVEWFFKPYMRTCVVRWIHTLILGMVLWLNWQTFNSEKSIEKLSSWNVRCCLLKVMKIICPAIVRIAHTGRSISNSCNSFNQIVFNSIHYDFWRGTSYCELWYSTRFYVLRLDGIPKCRIRLNSPNFCIHFNAIAIDRLYQIVLCSIIFGNICGFWYFPSSGFWHPPVDGNCSFFHQFFLFQLNDSPFWLLYALKCL